MHSLHYYDGSHASDLLVARYGDYLEKLPPAALLRLIQSVAFAIEHKLPQIGHADEFAASYCFEHEAVEAEFLDALDSLNHLPRPRWEAMLAGLVECLQGFDLD